MSLVELIFSHGDLSFREGEFEELFAKPEQFPAMMKEKKVCQHHESQRHVCELSSCPHCVMFVGNL